MKRALALAFLGVLSFAAPAFAERDAVIDGARASGLVGEQADGYLGFAPGAAISADLRGRVEQNNIRRRALYTQRATAANATVAEVGAAVACEVFTDSTKLQLGERYRDAQGVWRQFTASQPVVVPPICPR